MVENLLLQGRFAKIERGESSGAFWNPSVQACDASGVPTGRGAPSGPAASPMDLRRRPALRKPNRARRCQAMTPCLHSIVVTSAATMLAGEVDIRMDDAHMPCQCIVARERLVLYTECAADLLLPGVVDRVLMPGEVVGPGEDGVARLAGRRIDPFTLVRAGL